MTRLTKPITRRLNTALDGHFCSDAGNVLVVRLIPGHGEVPDLIELRPAKTRRPERIALVDVYRLAIRARVNIALLTKARARKEAKATRLAQERQRRAEKRLTRPID